MNPEGAAFHLTVQCLFGTAFLQKGAWMQAMNFLLPGFIQLKSGMKLKYLFQGCFAG